jgi:hypothetical protein
MNRPTGWGGSWRARQSRQYCEWANRPGNVEADRVVCSVCGITASWALTAGSWVRFRSGSDQIADILAGPGCAMNGLHAPSINRARTGEGQEVPTGPWMDVIGLDDGTLYLGI